jgi:hypothetical protein
MAVTLVCVPVDDHTGKLRTTATRALAACDRHAPPVAALLGGSGATGEADELSDLDLLLYYETLPGDGAVAAVREELGASEPRPIAPRSDEGLIEQFVSDGVTCQLAYTPVAAVEADIRRLVQDLDPDPLLLKLVGGLHDGLPLRGEELIGRWRAQAAYTDELARAVVARHWKIVPLRRLQAHLAARDAFLWRQQILVDAAFDLLAALAAANRVWFSSFQLKRTRKLVARLADSPPELADRLESLFRLEPGAAAVELERLVDETRAILSRRELLP